MKFIRSVGRKDGAKSSLKRNKKIFLIAFHESVDVGLKYRGYRQKQKASNEINTGLIASIAVLIRLTKIRQLNCHQVRSHGVNTPPTNLLQYRIAINAAHFPPFPSRKKIQVDRLDGLLIPFEKNEPRQLFLSWCKICWKFITRD